MSCKEGCLWELRRGLCGSSRKWNVVSTGDDINCRVHNVYTKYSRIRCFMWLLLTVLNHIRSSSLQYLLVNGFDSAR